MTTTIYERIKLLPQTIQDSIWSYNVEGHRELMRTVFNEFSKKRTYECCGCGKNIDMADYFEEDFSAEYFFALQYYTYCYPPYPSFGLVCCYNYCKTSRYQSFSQNRREYFEYRLNLFGLEIDSDYIDSDDDYDYEHESDY